MDIKLSEQEIEELLKDPVAWREEQKINRQRQLEDAQRSYMNDIEDIQREFYELTAAALAVLKARGSTVGDWVV